MCIRDSPRPVLVGVSAQGRRGLARQRHRSHAVSRPYDQSPVSYTHLRAHETVLDLVCRLLLENKKNNNKKKKLISQLQHQYQHKRTNAAERNRQHHKTTQVTQ